MAAPLGTSSESSTWISTRTSVTTLDVPERCNALPRWRCLVAVTRRPHAPSRMRSVRLIRPEPDSLDPVAVFQFKLLVQEITAPSNVTG
jgi:hypothetical protein